MQEDADGDSQDDAGNNDGPDGGSEAPACEATSQAEAAAHHDGGAAIPADTDDVVSLSDSEVWMGELVPGPEDAQAPFDDNVKMEIEEVRDDKAGQPA